MLQNVIYVSYGVHNLFLVVPILYVVTHDYHLDLTVKLNLVDHIMIAADFWYLKVDKDMIFALQSHCLH